MVFDPHRCNAEVVGGEKNLSTPNRAPPPIRASRKKDDPQPQAAVKQLSPVARLALPAALIRLTLTVWRFQVVH